MKPQSVTTRPGRSFNLLWWGQAFSLTGNSIQGIALPLWVWSVSGSIMATAATFAVETLPVVLLAPWAGFVADRFERRTVLLTSELLSAVVVGGLIVAVRVDSVVGAYAAVAAIRCLNTVSTPAAQAVIRTVVPEPALPKATSAFEALFGATLTLGPVAGSAVAGYAGIQVALWLNLVSFLISAVLTRGVARCPGHKDLSRPVSAMWSSVRNVVGDTILVRAATAEIAYFLFAGGSMALVIVLLQQRAGTALAGLYPSGVGVGWLAASVVIVRRVGARSRRLPYVAGAACGPVALLIVGCLHLGSVPVFFAAVLAGGVNVVIAGGVTLVYQGRTPKENIGRVFALRRAATNSAIGLSNVLLPALAGTALGMTTTLVLAGFAMTIATLALRPRRRAVIEAV